MAKIRRSRAVLSLRVRKLKAKQNFGPKEIVTIPSMKPATKEKPPQIAAIYLAWLSRSTLAVFLQHKLKTLYSTTQMDPAKHKRPSLVPVVRRSVQRTPLRHALSRTIQTAREDFAIVAYKT
jgi:hypothetical protein